VQEREVVEQLDVNQGKLNIGLRANVVYGDDDYPAALVYNGILGAFPHSKLFINVREKESLAYYASSRYDGHKGIIMIQTGIEIANKEKAERIIRRQLEDIRQGNITDDELAKTKAMIVNNLHEMDDSAYDLIGYHFNAVLSNRMRTKQELIDAVQQVDKSKVVEIARQVQLDTIYFLRDSVREVPAEA
jgi:predicted Zn-dependent peptidase